MISWRGLFRSLCGPLLLLLVAGTVVSDLAGQDGLSQRKQELERLRHEIDSNRRRIEKLKEKEAHASQLHESLETDRRLTRRYLEQLGEQEKSLRRDHAVQQAELLEMEVKAEETADLLRRRVQRYFRFQATTGDVVLFASESFGELFARGQFLKRIIQKDQLDLQALAQDRELIAQASEELVHKRKELDTLLAAKRAEEKRLIARGETLARELDELRDERSDHERRLRQAEASEAQIRKMIAELERARQRRGGEDFGSGFGELRGRLLWPLQGEILANFGVEIHPRYKTEVPQNGMIIQGEMGAPILACAAGEVVYDGWYDGYGRTVILAHGEGFYTIYAHASKIRVAKGDKVSAGAVVAEVGQTDSIRGPCLHFEIRRNSEALDPRKWLR